MATTAAGTPYVEASDLVAGYPAVSLALANHIDGLDGGKVLQVVRATDTTSRTTTSASFVDVTGMTVTITPTAATSSILLFAVFSGLAGGPSAYMETQITTSANVAISGAQKMGHGTLASNTRAPYNIIAYDSPATISSVTYKLRFLKGAGSICLIENNESTGQMYAIEVAA